MFRIVGSAALGLGTLLCVVLCAAPVAPILAAGAGLTMLRAVGWPLAASAVAGAAVCAVAIAAFSRRGPRNADCGCAASPAEDDPSTAIACTLPATAMPARLKEIASLVRDSLISQRRDGLKLELTFAPDALARVQAMVRQEQECCAFLKFELADEPAAVRVTITAPEAARAAATELFEVFLGKSDGRLDCC